MEAGVFVLGMHRSGTSAATNLVHRLGVPTVRESDRVGPSHENERGYWESSSLVAFNTRVLEAAGSETGCPVELVPGWERAATLAALREEAPVVFRNSFPHAPWVWKDPRNCLTFPFWRSVLDVRPVVILIHRNPLEVAASLEARSGEQTGYSLALWERYVRQALGSIGGLPVLVTCYEELLSSVPDGCSRVEGFLRSQGVATSTGQHDHLEDVVDTRLRHAAFTREDLLIHAQVSDAQRRLSELLDELRGQHDDFSPPPLGEETPTTETLLAERRKLVETQRELRRVEELNRSASAWNRIRTSRAAWPARCVYAGARRLVARRAAG
jgi:hypothetical protein